MVNFKELSVKLEIEEAVLRAVVDVESQGDGFLSNGEPKILFEPHIFWKRLLAHGINPKDHVKGNEDILYPSWTQGKYGKVSEQWSRMTRARKIHDKAALESASYGAYQVLGTNYKSLGYNSIDEFVQDALTEQGQTEMFIRFLKVNKLIPSLQKRNFTQFALKYNGSAALKNDYPKKLQHAYDVWKTKLSK